MSIDPYNGREQTRAKHFILKRYLEGLAFKVLTFRDITYVDGFSGPWQSETADHADSSFMIAIRVLKDAQERIYTRIGKRRRIRCFFSELAPHAFSQMQAAVQPFHRPDLGFEVETHNGKFEDAIASINNSIGSSFPLIFIDPTGWSGYPFDKIASLFARSKCEVLITFMYPFIYRFAHSDDESTTNSLSAIFGGPGWRDRLDPSLQRGAALEKLFRDTLKDVGRFKFVVSIRIDRAVSDNPHYYITYGTKSLEGLKEIRETEYVALREHAKTRAAAQETRRINRSGTCELFSGHDLDAKVSSLEDIVEGQREMASRDLLGLLQQSKPQPYEVILARLLERFMVRETDVKEICKKLAKQGVLYRSWGAGNRKPKEGDVIRLA